MPSPALYLHVMCVILKHGSALNTCSNDFIHVRRYIECVTSHKWKNHFGNRWRGDGGVAGEGRVLGVPKFH